MTLKFIPLTQIKLNPNNPRKIDKGRKDVIMKSLVNLPKMMTVRPIVIDKNYTVVGGNARLIALKEIKKMSFEKVTEILNSTRKEKTEQRNCSENESLEWSLNFWKEFFAQGVVPVFIADQFTESEISEFIIKDNQCVGEWDMNVLVNNYDTVDLLNYGFEPWELGLNDELDMELYDNALVEKAKNDFFSMTFTFPTTEKEFFEKYKKQTLTDYLLERVHQ